jgi:hypothetical protein
MALKGTLRDFSLADIFQLIGIQNKTGILTLKSNQEVVTVSFVDGSIVSADALQRRLEDRLGTVLVKSGRITETQLQEALRIQKNTLKRMGSILVEHRFIDAGALRDALRVQISQMVYRLFRWRDGEYNFSQEAQVDYDREHVVPMSAESILMEGARILDEWPMIEKGIKSFATVFRRAPVEVTAAPKQEADRPGEEEARGVTLDEQEMAVYGLVDGRRTVQEIVERSTLGEFDTCRLLYDLINRQLLEEAGTGSQKTPAAPAATPAAAPAARAGVSPALVGLGYLILVVVAGGALLYRGQDKVVGLARGETGGSYLAPLVRAAEVRSIRRAIGLSRLQRVDRGLQIYFLLTRGYPNDLKNLATQRLLKPAALIDPWGRPVQYELQPTHYRLWLAPTPDNPEPLEIRTRIQQ